VDKELSLKNIVMKIRNILGSYTFYKFKFFTPKIFRVFIGEFQTPDITSIPIRTFFSGKVVLVAYLSLQKFGQTLNLFVV